jgi:hypothetical protein
VFADSALDDSLISIDSYVEVPDCQERYDDWKRAWEAGLAVEFTQSVSSAIDSFQKICDCRNS